MPASTQLVVEPESPDFTSSQSPPSVERCTDCEAYTAASSLFTAHVTVFCASELRMCDALDGALGVLSVFAEAADAAEPLAFLATTL